MACRRPGDKSLSEPMLVFVPTHICVTLPKLVKRQSGSTGRAIPNDWRAVYIFVKQVRYLIMIHQLTFKDEIFFTGHSSIYFVTPSTPHMMYKLLYWF